MAMTFEQLQAKFPWTTLYPAEWHQHPKGGGWVKNTAHAGATAIVEGIVSGNAQVSGNAWVSGNAQVYGDARVYGNARVYGDAQVYGDARVYGPFPIAVRSDGYTFILVPTMPDGSGQKVFAGCQSHTLDGYRTHTKEYSSAAKRAETLLILKFLEAQSKAEKWA